MIPLTVTPKLLSMKNRWRAGTSLKGQFGRDLVLGSFSCFVMFSLYFGLTLVLDKAKLSTEVAYFHPGNILDILFMFLYGLLFFSSAITTLGLLYLSDDIPLLMSSPISKGKIFAGKLLEITASSTWMVLVFGLPGLFSFGVSYGGGISYYLISILMLIPYFLIPSAVSIGIITIFASIVPANRTKEIVIFIGGAALVAAYYVFRLISSRSGAPVDSLNDLLLLINLLKVPDTSWFPSHWAAVTIGQILQPSDINITPYIICLWASMLGVVSLSFVIFSSFYEHAYNKAQSSKSLGKMNSILSLGSLPFMALFYTQEERALLNKEISIFLRDMTQSVQLMLLLALCSVYLYNLRILRVVDQLPEAVRIWWQGFLTIGNMGMGAFVIAAVCTRFVFPSISLEGKAYWILRSSPMGISDLLKAKFKIWYFPVAFIGSILLLSGSFAIQAEPHLVIISALISWIVCYGIVGLGVGLGSVYANFDWEHSSQLAASFGSLVFMLSSTILIAVNLIPITLLMLIKNIQFGKLPLPTMHWYFIIGSCFIFLVYLNYAVAKWAMKIGENSLLEREN